MNLNDPSVLTALYGAVIILALAGILAIGSYLKSKK
jgi:hypothetical protein